MKITGRVFLSIVALLLLLWLTIQTTPVQNFIVHKITRRLSNDLHTEVSIRHVSFALFNSMNLEGTLVKDLNKDTLLYAGNVKVRITDWFFLKDELVLKYLGLEDAYINTYRQDSTWNYQFLVKYFSPATPKKEKKKSNLKFNLKRLDFKNVSFRQNDEWVGTLMEARAGNLQLEANDFDIEKNLIDIKQLDLEKPFFSLTDFEGRRPEVVRQKKVRPADEMYFNAGDLRLLVGSLTIKNGSFQNVKSTKRAPYPYFDALHLRFDKINGTVTNVSFVKDTIKANINLAAKERSGIEVRKLQTSLRLTPQIMEFTKLLLLTQHSRLQNYYAMHFEDLNKDFGDFINKVTMEARLLNATVDSRDLAFFAPETKSWNKQITISGYGKGLLTDLNMRNLYVRAGNNTLLTGDIRLKGLPEVDNMSIDFQNGNLQTNYRDAVTFLPAIAKVEVPALSSLGSVRYKGTFKGTIKKFNARGNFSSNLGAVTADAVMEFPEDSPTKYSGRVFTQKFDIGRFLRIKNMGTMSFDGNVNGVGLTLGTLRTTVSGKIGSLNYNDYTYRKINVAGTFQRKQFDGDVKIDDDNVDFYSTVKMDFRGAQPQFNVLGDLQHSDFKKLNLYKKDLQLSGLFDLDFSGKDIDHFLGSVKVFNSNLVQDSVRINFDSLTLSSSFEGDRRTLKLTSNEFEASVEGEYNILDLPNAFQTYLHKYYPAYIDEPRAMAKDQQFNFILNTRNVEGYTSLFNKDISGFSNSSIAGTINTVDTVFEVNADVPEFAYKKTKFNNISMTGRGNLDLLQLNGNVGNIWVSDSSGFPNTTINIVSQKDESEVSIKTRATNTLNELNLNTHLTTFPDGVRLRFNPSDFVINDKRWTLEKEGEIVIRKDHVSADNVRFTQNDQLIEVKTTTDSLLDKSNLLVNLQNLNIGDFAPLLTTSPRLEGLASGRIEMADFFGKFKVSADLRADQFRMDNDSVGIVRVKSDFNSENRKINYYVLSDNELYNFAANGSYDLSDSTGSSMRNTIILRNTKVIILNQFLNYVFSDIDGLASGELQVNGNPKSPQLLGKVTLHKGSLTVNFTKVRYTVDSATFVLNDDYIDFGSFAIKDKFGNTGTVSGKLYQKELQNISYDIGVNTSKLLLVDTKSTDNPQFYGTAIGKASMAITGPQVNMHMAITAEPVDSSQIYIPTTTVKESAEAEFIVFKQYGTEIKKELSKEEGNVIVDLDLTANPLAKIDVILDPITGDIIRATGNGRLKIHAGTIDPLTIKGRYEIQHGSYDFNFQSFIKKPFILREGANSFIEWNGDPYDARLQIQALYVAENVRLGDLVGGQNLSGTVQGYQGNVYVIANLSGKLKQPNIDFAIDFPPGEQVKNDETFNQFLNKLEKDENEMLKQVTYLIVFGSFAPYGQGKTLGENFTSLGVNTISEIISRQVDNLVSNVLYRITGDRSLQFDVSTTVYNSSNLFSGNVTATNSIDRQKVNFKLGKSLFDNKVLVTFGGDLDFRMGSNTATSQQLGNLQWLPDLTVEVILTKDRKVRAIFFSRNNLDITAGAVGRRNRQGASISYRKDFDSFLTDTAQNKQQQNATPPQKTSVVLPQNKGVTTAGTP